MTQYFKTKLNVTSKKTSEKLKAMAGTYRKIWNHAMDYQEDWIGYSLSYKTHFMKTAKLYEHLIEVRDEQFPFIRQMDGGMIKSVSLRANESFKRWFNQYPMQTKYRRPRYLSRKKDQMTFKTAGNVRIFNSYIEVPKLGKIKLYEKGYIPVGESYSNITFSYDGNDWWLSLEVKSKATPVVPTDLSGEAKLDITRGGDLLVDGKILRSAVDGEAYKRAAKKQKALLKKLKRQARANIVTNERGFKKTRTSRNMLKTKKAIAKVKTRLNNLRTDSFKKQASALARTKLEKLHCLSSLTMRQRRQGGLSRIMREKHTLDFLNVLCKRVEAAGAQIVSHNLTAASCTP